jgi:hypothetical protein
LPGILYHSPALIIARLMIGLGIVADPDVSPLGAWPVYTSNEPSSPDNCVTVYDTLGRDYGRTMIDGERQEHHGFQVRIRSVDHPTGYAKARALAVALDAKAVWHVTVSGEQLSPHSYCVWSVSRTGDVIDLYKNVPRTKRDVFTFNATTSIRLIA